MIDKLFSVIWVPVNYPCQSTRRLFLLPTDFHLLQLYSAIYAMTNAFYHQYSYGYLYEFL